MKNSDNGRLIVEEANGIIDNFIKRKTRLNNREKGLKNKKGIILLLILTITAAFFLSLIIKNI